MAWNLWMVSPSVAILVRYPASPPFAWTRACDRSSKDGHPEMASMMPLSDMNRTGLTEFLRAHPHPGGIVVCESRKFLYMKTAKNAGTSILRGYLEKEVSGVVHFRDHPEAFRRWLEALTDEKLEEYYIFSVVRNPWDRLVSVSIQLSIPLALLIDQFQHYQQFDEAVRVHSLPQHLYTHCAGRPFVNRICRFESVQEDMDLVVSELKLKPAKIPFLNRSEHAHYATYYTDAARDKVAALYAEEIALYGYTFMRNGDRSLG